MDEDTEVEILSYREFRNRQTLAAWRERQRAYERGDQQTEPRFEAPDDESIARQEALGRNAAALRRPN